MPFFVCTVCFRTGEGIGSENLLIMLLGLMKSFFGNQCIFFQSTLVVCIDKNGCSFWGHYLNVYFVQRLCASTVISVACGD